MWRATIGCGASAVNVREAISVVSMIGHPLCDAVERQLAHAERDAIRAAYNYVEHLPERRKMMQAWADCLSSLAMGADVIPLHEAPVA